MTQELLLKLTDQRCDTLTKLLAIFKFIKPVGKNDPERINLLIKLLSTNKEQLRGVCDEIAALFLNLKISIDITSIAMLSRNGFVYEIKDRFYNKFLPNPPKNGELKHIFATIFKDKNDFEWVCGIDDGLWLELFSKVFNNSSHIDKLKEHLFYELLYAMEILCVRIASEEFDENFIRLDDGLLNRDSAFIALARDIISFTTKLQSKQVCIDEAKLDYKHLEVIMDQCKEQIQRLKKRSINLGISVGFTYELECLEQMLFRLERVVYLVGVFGTKEFGLSFVDMFKEALKSVADKNALLPVLKQSVRIISKSITNNIGEHGEHYIVDDLKGYAKMFLSSAGAGIVIAIMALIKINILKADLSFSLNSILISLNYGLGFVLIHLVGFTVATKQPAMTASTFASEVQKDESNKANQGTLIELIFKVSRSQFASVMGNVSLALLISFLISKFMIANDVWLLDEKKSFGYLDSLEPFLALGFASIAGVWLFCSGLIAGYFDNRADVLELKDRFYHHPLLKRFLKDEPRKRVANYLHHHHGSIAGNFFFGILLGITPVIGYVFGINLDIAHVAFSSANLGYASTHIDIDIFTFLYYLGCVFMIGFVNLIVSFMLALKVSLISRDTSIGNLFLFLKALFLQMLKRPLELVFKSSKKV